MSLNVLTKQGQTLQVAHSVIWRRHLLRDERVPKPAYTSRGLSLALRRRHQLGGGVRICSFASSRLIGRAVFINALSSFALRDLARLDDVAVSRGVGSLIVADEVLALGAALLWGVAIDRLGLRSVVTASHAIMALSFALMATVATSFGAQLVIRLVFSVRSG